MGYMRTATVYINEGHPLFQYADNLTALTNNLSNTARFRQRQVLSAVSKEEADWTTNEREVMEEIFTSRLPIFATKTLSRRLCNVVPATYV